MRIDVRMPQFGESAAEATVVAWLVKPGETVNAEQELVEVQTEKSLLTVAAPAAGVLAEHVVGPGQAVAVGDVLAFITATGKPAASGHPAASRTAPPPAPPRIPTPAPTAPGAAPIPAKRSDPMVRATWGEGAFISPAVRARLASSGLKVADLALIPGTGAGGRVTVADIDRYLARGEPMSGVRLAVAKAMERSWQRPLATVARSLRMDALLDHRRTVEGRPSATVYALRALALALAGGSPLACRMYGHRLHRPATIDLALAVEVGDGVVTPVVRGVEHIPLAELTVQVETTIEKARAGRVTDLGEAVGSVSNYGVFGIDWATPVPLPGQGLILGLGAPRNTPEWDPASKGWGRARTAELTLTFDHRIADGGAAGRLLKDLVEFMEHPGKL